MGDKITPEAVERFDCHGWDVRRGQMLRAEHGDYVRASDYAALARELAEVKAERDGYREWGADVKRLTRKLDVEMHGEENAAQQASLCDLIGAGKELRERAEKAEAALATARAQIVAAQVDMRERAYHAAAIYAPDGWGEPECSIYLSATMDCRDNIRALPLTDPADALAEHDRKAIKDAHKAGMREAGDICRALRKRADLTEDEVCGVLECAIAIQDAINARGEQEGT